MTDTYSIHETPTHRGSVFQVYAHPSDDRDVLKRGLIPINAFDDREVAEDFIFLLNWVRGMRERGVTQIGPSERT